MGEPEAGAALRAWVFRFALGAFLCAVPLVLFGGSVTTLGAGMAVEGWLIAEGHFLVFFPVQEWLRDTGTFVEHSHRLCAVLVGLCSLAAVLGAWKSDLPRAAKIVSLCAFLAVCGQGAVGGMRVLESSPQLAFLHGALAQAVLALLATAALLASPGWKRRAWFAEAPGAGLRHLARIVVVVVYAQVFLGAWYRHSLRPTPQDTTSLLFIAHAVGALAVLVLVGALAERLGDFSWSAGAPGPLRRASRWLGLLLVLQILLGGLAWLGYRPAQVGPLEWVFSISHVLVGGLLLAQCTLVAVGLSIGGPCPSRRPSSAKGMASGAGVLL